ncbi:unnamed protein product [Staurois parvus]|uniref:Uncharacterized protein n=1 Tax=Staurois parvus TaxID=386267 RepID=A0ABN9AE81_9NEOB|nr:unnamed protein product [Staurois parvus]
MTRDCRPLGSRGGGEQVPEFDRYPLPLPQSCLSSPSSGTRDRSQKTARPFTKHSPSCACTVGTQL